jgi:hypothetical protein
MASKREIRARQLMALAVGSPYSEEGRTAALAAVRVIHEEGLLDRSAPATPRGLGLAPAGTDLEGEVTRLRAEVARLRAVRHEAQPAGSALLALDAASKMREIETLRREVTRLRALMPSHVVRSGESPRLIAEAYTGSASRVPELLRANPQKPLVPTQEGWTFRTIYIGERLWLPAGWV